MDTAIMVVMDIMDTMERERLKLRLQLNQDTTIMDTAIMVVMDIMDTMERERLKLRLQLNQDTTIMDIAIMVVMDIMDTMVRTLFNGGGIKVQAKDYRLNFKI